MRQEIYLNVKKGIEAKSYEGVSILNIFVLNIIIK